MDIQRSKNASRNIFYGVILKFFNIIVPFILRTVMIYVLGMEYVGLNSLFTSVLSVLNLAELGVESAIVFSMYEPIAHSNTSKICSLMNLYKKYYRIIGFIILILGLAAVPFLPKLIKGEIPKDVDLYVIYLITLASTVSTYWLFAYKKSLLNAHLRNDVISKVSIVVTTVTYSLQILFLFITKNYYSFVIIMLIMNIINNIVTAIVVTKMYPDYTPKGTLSDEEINTINGKIKDLFTAKVGTIIVDSVDSIVISAFLGLRILALYQNYYYVFSAIFGFVVVLISSCIAGIGNSIIVETTEKNLDDLKKFTLLISWFAGFCCCCFACLYQPFMTLWVGVENLLPYENVILFCIYFYIKSINALLNVYKDAAGIWHEDRFRPLVTAFTNLTLNLIMVQFMGLYGIVLSTVLSTLLIGMPWLYHNLFKLLFKKASKSYILKTIAYFIISCISVLISVFISSLVPKSNEILVVVIRAIVCIIIPNVLFFIACFGTAEFKGLLDIADDVTNYKIPIISKMKNIHNKLKKR